MKRCPRCNEFKTFEFFYKEKRKPNGIAVYCKKCSHQSLLERNRKKRSLLPPKIKRIKEPKQIKVPKVLIGLKIKKERKLSSSPKTKEELKVYRREYMRNRLKTNIDFRLKHNLRSRLYAAVKKNYQKGKTLEILGCDISSLKQHLSSMFRDGMTWDNYGSLWEIDHIIPLCTESEIEKIQKLCHYSNLQPLTINENRTKPKRILR